MSETLQMPPIESGYYCCDTRRSSLGEFHRITGGGVESYIFGPFRRLLKFPPGYAIWMPTYWEDTLASPEDISERGMEAILPHIAELERIDFRLISYQKTTRMIWPALLDNCGAVLFHSSGEFMASIVRQEFQGGKTSLAISVGFCCQSGKWITVTSTNGYFDPVKPSITIALPDAPTQKLWQRAQQERNVLVAQGGSTLSYPTTTQWKNALDEHQAELWHDRINVRKLFRKLTAAEIEILRQQDSRVSC